MAIEVTKLSYALGAEVSGLDLSRPLGDETAELLRQAWRDHLVLVIRGQEISMEDHVRFGGYFGEVVDCPLLPYQHPDTAKILLLSNQKSTDGKVSQTRRAGQHWHTDLSYTTEPATGSILLGREVPDIGGDTMFTNMYMAYENLSPLFQKMIASMLCVHDMLANTDMSRRDPKQVEQLRLSNPPVAQPMVRIHSQTGRPALFVSEQQVQQIVGMTKEESAGILSFLSKHAVRPEFTYRHQWRRHDIVMWDNRATLHLAVGDGDGSQARVMHRVTLRGEMSGQVIDDDPAVWQPAESRVHAHMH